MNDLIKSTRAAFANAQPAQPGIFRSNVSAQRAADDRGLVAGTYTITRLATAKYELTVDAPTSDDMTLSQIADAIEARVEPVAKPVRAAKPTRVNKHHNDDGSITIYIKGVKVRRFGGDENEEASEEEMEDTEAFIERYLSKRFLKKNGGWVWGRTTQGHNWHTKRQKALRARILAGQEAGHDVSELEAELAKISGRA